MLLVNDPAFEDACRVLHANGYIDIPMDQSDYKMKQPPDSDPDGKEAVPASHWHFKVTDDTSRWHEFAQIQFVFRG